MNRSGISNVLKLEASERFAYFVRKVTDGQAVWGLHESGWASAKNDDGQMLVPFWPEKEFAELCANGPWSGYKARPIGLRDLLAKWLPGMLRDGIKPAVFPTPTDRGVIESPQRLAETIEAENAQYE